MAVRRKAREKTGAEALEELVDELRKDAELGFLNQNVKSKLRAYDEAIDRELTRDERRALSKTDPNLDGYPHP